MTTNEHLLEGGNVFKDASGKPTTQRINQRDIPPTVSWLEKVTGLPLMDTMLGSTGKKPSSGDIDLGIDANTVQKDAVYNRLVTWAKNNDLDPNEYVARTGISVHFKTPIRGNPELGFVQADLMFVPDMRFAQFMMTQDPASEYKGMIRNVLMNSIAKASGYKLSLDQGLLDRQSGNTITKDPDQVAQLLLNKNASAENLFSVEAILQTLANDPDRDAKLADFRGFAEKQNIQFEEADVDDAVSIMARLRDRIVNQGLDIIVEAEARIPHPEDDVFEKGSAGARAALNALKTAAAKPSSTTVKWDGKPAIVFGRDAQGNFILTDKGGFLKTGGTGLARSPDDLADLLAQRKGNDRSELIQQYRNIWPLIQSITPRNLKGFVQADLLYVGTPSERNGEFVFTPNIVTYSVPVNSDLGQGIANSKLGLAVHSYIENPQSDAKPISPDVLADNPDVLALGSSTGITQAVELNTAAVKKAEQLLSRYSRDIDQFLNPNELRAQKITNLPALLKQFINVRVRQGSFDNLAQGFLEWVATKETAPKAQRIQQWAQQYQTGFKAAIGVFMAISAIKTDLVKKLDASGPGVKASIDDEPGHEGYVGHGYKYVDRARFSKANFAQNI